MLQSPLKKQKKRSRILIIGCTFLLLAVLSTSLFLLRNPSLTANTNSTPPWKNDTPSIDDSADIVSAESVLRGTIYDRNYQELAVSYPLYSLQVHPAEVTDPEKTATALAEHLDKDAALIQSQIQTRHHTLTIADDLDQDQALEINALKLSGILCNPSEHRFYPHHEIAAHLLGFMEDDLGLMGIEGRFNHILQSGVFQTDTIPEIDFKTKKSAGIKGTDLVLTIDLDIQKLLTERLDKLVGQQNSGKAEALLLDIKNGGVLAMVNLPSFNPNYFWQSDTSRQENRVVENLLEAELYRNLLIRATAVAKSGELGDRLLPITVAAPDYNLTKKEIQEFVTGTGIHEPIDCDLSLAQRSDFQSSTNKQGDELGPTSGLKLLATVAAFQNGGTEIMPHLLAAVHDRESDELYPYVKANLHEQGLYRTLSPTMGVRMRMELFKAGKLSRNEAAIFTGSTNKIINNGLSTYVMQDLLIAMIPRQNPRFALLITRQHDTLLPRTKRPGSKAKRWLNFSKKTLAILQKNMQGDHEAIAEFPPLKNRENYNRFLISRRMSVPPESAPFNYTVHDMPEVKGMSLRKGLQALAGRNLFIRVRGSGRIVAQQPKAGTKLQDVGECVLVLEPPI